MSDMYFKNLPDTTTPIIDVNLNKLNDVKVSTTEPITGEKIWIKKGKNILNKDTMIDGYRFGSDGLLFSDSSYSASDFIKVLPNTTYTCNWTLETRECVCYYDKNGGFISKNVSDATFTTPANCKYIRISRLTTQKNTAQVELGSTSTTYENFIEEEILVKNDNGVYEEFINISDAVRKSGDVMTAPLRFENTDNYNAIRKSRIISGQEYELTLGIGGNKSARIELVNAGTVVGAIEVRDNGTIYNSKTNKQLIEDSVEEGTLTDLNSFFSSIDFKRVIKHGRVIQIAFRGQLSRNISPSDKFLKAPYIPNLGTNLAGVLYLGGRYSTDNLAWFYMDGSGYFQGVTATSGKYIHINLTYLA